MPVPVAVLHPEGVKGMRKPKATEYERERKGKLIGKTQDQVFPLVACY